MTAREVGGWVFAAVLVAPLIALLRRRELVAQAEHELRGSLTALSLAVDMLGRTPARHDAVEALETQLARADAGLADLGAARRGRRAQRRVAEVALDRFVSDTAAAWDQIARRCRRRVGLDWRAGPVTVEADRRRLAQVLGNLLANAVEHGDGRVELCGRRSPGGVRVEVRDAGRGLNSDGRVDRRRRRGRNRGRGLDIAARAAEEAGGSLTIATHSTGTAVAVELPVEDA